ncbi:unnamed protein product, partial [Mesorhabditis spiculigera]
MPPKKAKTSRAKASQDAPTREEDPDDQGPATPGKKGETKRAAKRKGKNPSHGAPQLLSKESESPGDAATKGPIVIVPPPTTSDPILAGVDAWVQATLTLGVGGLKKQFLDVKGYQSPNQAATAFAANPTKNRYPELTCLDETRVKLTPEVPGEGDYIHANWCRLENHPTVYIATQSPVDASIVDFWRMVWEYEIVTVCQLSANMEDGKVKGSNYWPAAAGQFQNHGRFFVNNKKVETEESFVTLTIELLPDGCSNSRMLRIVQYDPAAKEQKKEAPLVPLKTTRVLRLIRLLDRGDKLNKGNTLMHCSSGVGRTGTFILVEWLLAQLYSGRKPADLPELYKKLRGQRAHAVQTEFQYVFITAAVLDYCQAKHPGRYTEAAVNAFIAEAKELGKTAEK